MSLDDQTHLTPILSLASESATLALAGGKGANLARLAQAGLPVPAGFTITTQAYHAFAAANGLAERIAAVLSTGSRADPDACEDASARIRDLFRQGSLPADLAAQILDAYAALGRPAVAVRSSATAEDLPEMSFAGQQDTYLNVIGADALLQAVVACWGSLWTARAISYRERNGVAHADVSQAVVVQQMVESEASGVLFTTNPLTGLRSETVIDATVGLGEALVSGQVQPDHYVVAVSTGQIISRTLGAKALSVRSRPGGGTMTTPEDTATAPALSDPQILALAALGQQVFALYDDTPQDIEWALAKDTLYLLQARQITSLFPMPAGLSADPLWAMLSFGAVQGMLDPITPLGRNLLEHIIAAGAQLFGMTVKAETQNALFTAGERLWINLTPLLRNTVGRRIIPGITSWVDPGGGASLDAIWHDPRLQPTRHGISRGAAGHIAHAAAPLAGLILLNLLFPDRRRRYIVGQGERLLGVAAERCAAIQGEPRARLAQLAVFAPAFIAQYLPPTFRLFVSGVASGMAPFNLVRVLTRGLPGITDDRFLEITRGLPNNPTTEMDLALWQISQVIRGDPASRTIFDSQGGAALAAAYRAGALPAAAQQALETFMARYGSRGLAEIDLGRPRWWEDPAHVMEVVAGYLRITDPEQAPDAVFARGAAASAAAVDELVAAARRGSRGWLRARLVRFAAGRARLLMALRESPKFFAVRLFGLIRAELLSVGQELAAAGELGAPDDLFFLSFAELAAFAAGEPRDWAGLIAQRRQANRREERRRQVPRLLLSDGRALYAGMQSAGSAAVASLVGSPVSPGSVEGFVRVVLDPRRADLLPGEIMVCRGTDPSWTPLFLIAGGLIMEVGGLMTHGAVVAREYGIPAIVGVDRATERLGTGQHVALNGSTGEIRLLDADEALSDAQSGESA
jgi:phosphohistidine swiveling domain-containing protein